ncbi:MAG: hypothetical protein FJ253_08335 [Phycisphaerae bacterium]|nr:hypothetical protein [Phycisphaerae bacterium]
MGSRRHSSLIAVDYGSATVRLLQVEAGHVTALELPCEIFAADPMNGSDDPGGLAEDLERLLRENGIRNTRCAVTLPASAFLVDTVPMPELDEEERLESLAVEAVDRFGVDPNEVTVAALPLRVASAADIASPAPASTPAGPTGGAVSAPGPVALAPPAAPAPSSAPIANAPSSPAPAATPGTEHLLIAVRRSTAMRALDPLLRAKLVPVRLESAALAGLRTAWCHWSRQVDGAIAFVHVEPTMAAMLLARDGELLFHRAIAGSFGVPRVAPATSDSVDPDAIPVEVRSLGADRRAFRWSGLADEILQCLRYVERRSAGQWPAALVTSGPCAGQVELLATLESICGVPSHAVTAAGVVDPLPATLSPSIWAAALGSAAVDLVAAPAERERRAA